MKIRTSFVTNSSSSSFTIYQLTLKDGEALEITLSNEQTIGKNLGKTILKLKSVDNLCKWLFDRSGGGLEDHEWEYVDSLMNLVRHDITEMEPVKECASVEELCKLLKRCTDQLYFMDHIWAKMFNHIRERQGSLEEVAVLPSVEALCDWLFDRIQEVFSAKDWPFARKLQNKLADLSGLAQMRIATGEDNMGEFVNDCSIKAAGLNRLLEWPDCPLTGCQEGKEIVVNFETGQVETHSGLLAVQLGFGKVTVRPLSDGMVEVCCGAERTQLPVDRAYTFVEEYLNNKK